MVNLGRFSPQPLSQWARVGLITNAAGVERNPALDIQGMDYCGAPADGDRFYYYLFCDGTETMCDIQGYRQASSGIVDLYLNGVLDTAGIDLYNAVLVGLGINVALTTDTIPGINTVQLRVNGRNGASADFYVILNGVRLR